MTTTAVHESPAIPLLLSLEAAGFQLAERENRLLIRPIERLSAEARARLRQYHHDVLTVLRDEGVRARRVAFISQYEAAPPGTVPAFSFREGIAYVRGVCFCCGDHTGRDAYGCCWRCALARRLAVAGFSAALGLARDYDEARIVA